MLSKLIRAIDANPYLFHAVNLLLCCVWVWYAYRGLRSFLDSDVRMYQVMGILLVVMNSLLVLFFVLRRRSTSMATDAASVVLGHLGTWLSLLFEGATPRFPALVPACWVVMNVALAVSLVGFVSLGRSWGIIPANRGVRLMGMYRFVRHPIYASYLVLDSAWTLAYPTPRNVALVAALMLIQYQRAKREEIVLRADPAYAAYTEKTRYMFIPGVI